MNPSEPDHWLQADNPDSREQIVATNFPPHYGAINFANETFETDDRNNIQQDTPKRIPSSLRDERFGFDINFVKRFYGLHRLLYSKVLSPSSALFVLLLSLVLLKEYVVYQVGLIASAYYVALGNKDVDAFWTHTAKSIGLILAVTFINSITEYVKNVITATFRKTLGEASHRVYFADIRYYQMNVLDKAIDNPDQRMTQDINKFCVTYSEVLPKLIVSPFTIGYYCYQGYQRSGWQGPVGCFGFFVVATTVNKLIMSPIVTYVVKQEKCEGDLRFVHMLVRVYSESIAFLGGSTREHEKVNRVLDKLVDTQRILYFRQFFLSFSTNFVDYIGSIFSYLMLAIPIFSGQHDNLTPTELSSLISQNAFILIYLIFTFTSVVDLSYSFTDVAGVTHRIGQLFERLKIIEEIWSETSPGNQGRKFSYEMFSLWKSARNGITQKIGALIRGNEETDIVNDSEKTEKIVVWTLENATLVSSKGEDPLVTNFNYEFVVGESVIITGLSGAGKTSIFRVLRGLWSPKSGKVISHHPPGSQGIYFCPQKGYLTWGSLREQISFPLPPEKNSITDQLILHYIDKLKLTSIISRAGGLDNPCSWSVYDSLSPGEMQRLCILRIFYHQPVVAVLDEVTSALSFDMEKFVYSELKRIGITLISVGHRESIRKYHDKQIVLDSKGGWKVSDVFDKI